MLGALGLAALGLSSASAAVETAPTARADEDKQPRPKFQVSPPPDDVNDLSLEVAALRTMYLLKASPDQDLPDHNQVQRTLVIDPKAEDRRAAARAERGVGQQKLSQ